MRDPLSEESIEDSDSLEEIPALPNGKSIPLAERLNEIETF